MKQALIDLRDKIRGIFLAPAIQRGLGDTGNYKGMLLGIEWVVLGTDVKSNTSVLTLDVVKFLV